MSYRFYEMSIVPAEQAFPGHEIKLVCGATHKGYWRCAMVAHPETPDQHYFIEDAS